MHGHDPKAHTHALGPPCDPTRWRHVRGEVGRLVAARLEEALVGMARSIPPPGTNARWAFERQAKAFRERMAEIAGELAGHEGRA